jgi:type I restriction enzyme S subunit
MSELPKGWAAATLGDVLTFERGLAFPSTDKRHEPGDGLVACLRTTNVQAEVDWSDLWFIPRHHVKNPVKLVLPNDILMSTANSQALVGKVSRVRSMPMEATFGAFIGVLRPVDAVSPAFVHYRVASGEFQERLRGTASQTTNIANISSTAMLELPVDLPPLNEQRRIVDKLDAVFERSRAAKARLERLPALLEKLKRSILTAAFRGDLTKDWRAANPNVEPANVLLERIRAERRRRWEDGLRAKGKDPKKAAYEEPAAVDVDGLPELPEGWAWASLNQLAHRVTDGTHQPPTFTDSGVPFVFVKNIMGGVIDLNTDKFVSVETFVELTRRCPVEVGDILYSAVGSYGVAVSVDTAAQFTFQRHIAHIKLEVGANTAFLRNCLNSPFCRQQADSVARGVAQKTVTLGELSLFRIPVAPAAEQDEINTRLAAALEVVSLVASRHAAAAARMRSIEQAALAKAFRGELVPQDPTDEPASVLLDRIRAARADSVPRRGRRTSPPAPLLSGRGEPEPRSAPLSLPGEGSARSAGGEVVRALQEASRLSAAALVDVTGLDAASVKKALKALVDSGQVRVEGKARGTTYVWSS